MSRDRWSEVKAGAGAVVEEFSAAEELAVLMGGSDLMGMSPEQILIGLESGSFEFLSEGE